MLYAYGDEREPLDATVRVLDEIVTDFIIETAYTAHKAADYSGRQKIKNDDFMFAIRKDEYATGRVKELHLMDKRIKEERKQFDTEEGKTGLERGGRKKVQRTCMGLRSVMDSSSSQFLFEIGHADLGSL